jgi:hypothetical protein
MARGSKMTIPNIPARPDKIAREAIDVETKARIGQTDVFGVSPTRLPSMGTARLVLQVLRPHHIKRRRSRPATTYCNAYSI